jgi:hypothetical protein
MCPSQIRDRERRASIARWTLAECEAQLGVDHVAWIRSLPHPVQHCECRAVGWWDANDLDTETIYRRLAALLAANGAS